jgi:hypothetical protein
MFWTVESVRRRTRRRISVLEQEVRRIVFDLLLGGRLYNSRNKTGNSKSKSVKKKEERKEPQGANLLESLGAERMIVEGQYKALR